MSSQSPSSVLYSSDGYELAVIDASPYVAGTRSLLVSGKTSVAAPTVVDGDTDILSLDGYGNLRVTMLGGTTIGANGSPVPASSTLSGGQVNVNQPNYLTQDGNMEPISLDGYGNLRVAITGGSTGTIGTPAPTLADLEGALVSLVAPDYSGADGYLEPLSLDGYGSLRVTLGTSVSNVVINSGNVTLVGGPVGTNGTTAPAVSVENGGVVSLTNPNYTGNAGALEPLSLDGYGNLRVTFSGTTSSSGANGTTAPSFSTQVGGLVSSTQPNYTGLDGDMEPLSLDGYGNLRVAMTGGSTGTVGALAPTLADLDGALVSLTSPNYQSNNGDLEPLSLDGYGNLRVTMLGSTFTATNGTTAPTVSVSDGAVVSLTTPNYTGNNGALEPLSMDGYGNLRVAIGNTNLSPLVVTTNKASTSVVTAVPVVANSNNVLLASNGGRVAATIFNGSKKIAYIKYGATASLSSYTMQIMPNSYFEVQNDWTGEIDAFFENGASGNVLVTEMYI